MKNPVSDNVGSVKQISGVPHRALNAVAPPSAQLRLDSVRSAFRYSDFVVAEERRLTSEGDSKQVELLRAFAQVFTLVFPSAAHDLAQNWQPSLRLD